MNILPKKSWHVRTKKNIERVRRDEAEAAEKEKELSKRAQRATFEASLDILRKRNGTTSHDKTNGAGGASSSPLDVASASGTRSDNVSSHNNEQSSHSASLTNPSGSSGAGHLNLFREVELAEGKLHGGNLEAEAERKREQEEWEKKVGILQYLGQNSNLNEDGEQRFYQKLNRTIGAVGPDAANAADASAVAAVRKRDDLEKAAQDPLRTIQKYLLAKKEGPPNCASSSAASASSSAPAVRQKQAELRRIEFLPEGVSNVRRKAGDKRRCPSISSSSTDDEYSRRQRKRKKAKKSKRRRTPSSESDPESEEERRDRKRSNLDLLRRQRLERERRESERTREYLANLVGKVHEEETTKYANRGDNDPSDDRNRRYNSQYNPHLARY